MLKRFAMLIATVAVVGLITANVVQAANPHFVGTPTATRSGDVLTVSFKVAGLGDNESIDAQVTADAQCWNRGGNAPKAENKGAVLASGTFTSDKNGNVVGTLSGSAQTDPQCNPPMELRYTNVTLTAGDLTFNF